MMDPSEQCVHNNDLNPNDAAAEQFDEDPAMRQVDDEEHVLGILEIQEIPDQATLILQPEGLNLDGQHIYIEHNGVNGEYFVVVQENITGDESEVILDEECENKLELNNDEGSYGENTIPHNSEQQSELPYENPDNTQNESAFNPTSSDSSIVDSLAEGGKNEKLLHLAVVAQEMQSADANYSTSQHLQDFQCSQSISEGSVIVSQIHPDTDSALYRSSETEVSSSTDLASEHDSHSGIDANVQAEIPTIERKTSFSCISSTRTLDNTVSVIHTTSSTHNDLGKGVESNYISNDYNVRHESEVSIAKSDKSEDSVAALHINISHDNCSNPNDNVSNQDEDIVSQNCGLDLTKESNLDDPVCDDDSFPVVEHSRSRYGIMDSLNKDKQNPYSDTNTSEDIEDTLNSSSMSTNITDDNESVSENNSNQMEYNNEEIGDENNVSPELLSTENENYNVKYISNVDEACDSSNSEISHDSQTANDKKQTDHGKSKLRSFNLPSDANSNSKSTTSSDNIPSPSLLNKDLNTVKRRGRPSRETKKVMDAYEFDDTSAEKEENLPENEASEILEEETNNSNISTSILSGSGEVVEEGSAPKLTFHEALSSVLDKEDKKTRSASINSDQSADIFDGESEVEENNDVCDNHEDLISNEESVISKQEDNQNKSENAIIESPETQNALNEPCSSKGNVVTDVLNAEETLPAPSQKTLFEGKETENDLVKPPIRTYFRKRKAESDLVKPSQKTIITKRKVENVKLKIGDDESKEENDREKVGNDKDRIELFSCDDLSSTKDNKNPFNVDSLKDTDSACEDQLKEFGMDDDGMESNVQSKVSATYKRKRKNVPPIVRANRTRSLRKRSSKTMESEEDEAEEDSSLRELQEHLNSPVTGKVNEHNWGHILLGTKFSSEPGSADPPTISSTIPNSSSPSRNRKRPAWFTTPNSNKSQFTSGKQFDKLIKSSPSKVKCRTSNEKKKLRDKVKKQAMSLCNSLLPNSSPTDQKRGRPKTKVAREPYREVPLESSSSNLKKCGIKYLCERPVGLNSVYDRLTSSVLDPNLFYCSNKCGFACSKINNLIYHRKNCSSEFDSNDLEDSSKLFCDMDKRQRIRGETKHKEKECNGSSMDWQEPQPSCSMTYQRKCSDEEKYDRHEHRKKFGFAERDIVWLKRGRQYWPALVSK